MVKSMFIDLGGVEVLELPFSPLSKCCGERNQDIGCRKLKAQQWQWFSVLPPTAVPGLSAQGTSPDSSLCLHPQ